MRLWEDAAYDQSLPDFSHMQMKLGSYHETPQALLDPQGRADEEGLQDAQAPREATVVVHRGLEEEQGESTPTQSQPW